MKRAIVLQHVAFEGPAKVGTMLQARGYRLDLRRLDLGEPVPAEIGSGDALVVMGGPMGLADLERPAYPFLRPEVELLRLCVAQDAPVLGVCLGAQLLAFATGAAVEPMKTADGQAVREVGWGPVRLHPSGPDDRILGGLGAEIHVLHWHGDRFQLPRGGRRLASTPLCPNQAFQLGSRAFGLQFHCEVEAEQVEDFLRADEAFVMLANGSGGVEGIRSDTARNLDSWRGAGDLLLGNILDVMTRLR